MTLYAYYQTAGLNDGLSMGVALIGWIIGFAAYNALGHEGTYLGREIGLPQFKNVGRVCLNWPYGNDLPLPAGGMLWLPAVWEPMYMGQIHAHVGLFLAKDFRDAYPILVPMHVTLYAAAILQEKVDWHYEEP